jgi:hypothetical protein
MSSTAITADATLPDAQPSPTSASRSVAEVLVCLPAIAADALPTVLEAIASAFPGEAVLVASSDPPANASDWPSLELIPYSNARTGVGWVLAVGDYAAAAHLAVERDARAVILLGDDTAPIDAHLLRSLADSVRTKNIDLVLPRFTLGPNDALVNSGLLYPLSRALFGADIHFPLPIDAALSTRLAQRLATSTQRLMALNQGSSLLWPVSEAAAAGLSVREIPAADIAPPAPPQDDFNALFATVASPTSMPRHPSGSGPAACPSAPSGQASPPPIAAYRGLLRDPLHDRDLSPRPGQPAGGLVPGSPAAIASRPQEALRALARRLRHGTGPCGAASSDFTVAFHLRTINRNHLAGAMTRPTSPTSSPAGAGPTASTPDWRSSF